MPVKPTFLECQHEHTILVLQGGGALGAYQAGVYSALTATGLMPDWIAGVSIGAINAALIAGNPPERRLERLRLFWERVSSAVPFVPPSILDPLRSMFNNASAKAALFFGVPGFFTPQLPPPWFAPDGTRGALSLYSAAALKSTLNELVDFQLINQKQIRLSLGAVNVETGNSCYFDNREQAICAEHVMASCALPPGFGPVDIDGQHYWDGGIVSNTPLWHVLDDTPDLNALIFQVDLFSARGVLPKNLDEVLEREKDIRYSSKTRFNTRRVKEIENLALALDRVIKKLPPELAGDADVQRLTQASQAPTITIAHLINRRAAYSASSKDYEFSRQTMLEAWQAGETDVRRSIEHPQWSDAMQLEPGVRVYDLAQTSRDQAPAAAVK